MNYLLKKFYKDIIQLWPQFISVFIMAMLSVAIYAGMNMVWTGMNRSYNDYVSDTNLADVFVNGNDIDENMESDISKLSYVEHVQPSMLVKYDVNADVESDLYVNTFDKDTFSVMKPLVRNGNALDPDQEGIWIDEDYANAHGIKKGDKVELAYANVTKEVVVLGSVLDAENSYFITSYSETVPDHKSHGYAYMSEKYAKKMLGMVSYNQLRLELKNDVSKEKLHNDLKDVMGEHFYSVTKKEDKASVTQVEDEINQVKKMAILFSMVFILLSILSMYTTMNRLVNNQIMQIGTLKSLGFFSKQIYIYYGMYGFIVAFLGSVAGLVLGNFLVAPIIFGIKQSTLTLPVWDKMLGGDCFGLIIMLMIICIFSSVITARKVIKSSPALTIRGQLENQKESKKKYKKTKLSYDWLWTLRSTVKHPIRLLMGVISVMGSVVLLVAGIGVWDSLSTSTADVFEQEYKYQYVGNLSQVSKEKVEDVFRDKNVQHAQIESTTISFNAEEKEGTLVALGKGNSICLKDDVSGKKLDLSKEEGVMSYQFAQKLGVKKGDEVEYAPANSFKKKRIKITAITDAKMPQGLFLADSKIADYVPNTLYVGDKGDYGFAKNQKFVSNLISLDKQSQNMDEMMNSVKSVVYILILASFILSAVILYNLGILSCMERYREYATMKVIGFYDKELNGLVFKESLINLGLGFILGIPLSMVFLKIYIGVVAMDSMEWTPYITKVHFALIVLLVIAFVFLINLIVCKKIKRINLVEALKGAE